MLPVQSVTYVPVAQSSEAAPSPAETPKASGGGLGRGAEVWREGDEAKPRYKSALATMSA
ncbi:hypothetical protein RE428_27580 [Marinobacter nanhaiticus D15-8W]|nr:hypothetical protein RE428_27580 [Marinobacter nanhaiticus D15-8W]